MLPPVFMELLEDQRILDDLTPADLREMSKFEELPNIEGLAAHPIRYPMPATWGPVGLDVMQCTPGAPGLEERARRALARELRLGPCICIRGRLAGGGEAALGMQVIVPMTHAQVAAAFQRLLWPMADQEQAIIYTLFFWPEPLRDKKGVVVERERGHWPEDHAGWVIGCDDPRVGTAMLLDAGRRAWAARGVKFEETRSSTNTGEAIWPVDFEPRVGGRPIWANPAASARWLARDRRRHAAALAPGALLFGVEVDEAGKIPLFHADESAPPDDTSESGWIVFPRAALVKNS